MLQRLADEPVFLPIIHGDAVYYLPYTGRNAGIEREQTRGLFFEAMELEELRKVVGPGAHVVDVGANTGNHTIFFAGPMKAASVVPFEPLPAAAAALRASVARNDLQNVDLSRLGIGVSDGKDRMRLVFSGRGGLGATSLEPDPAGEIIVAPLDSMVSGRVDLLKVDVEGMEMSVLAGSRELIRRWKPLIFIEIANRNTPALMDWLKRRELSGRAHLHRQGPRQLPARARGSRLMRFFVTGTAGFIGFHLARRLLDDGHTVVGYDGVTPYYDIELKRRRHEILTGKPGFLAVEAMLEDAPALRAAAEKAAPEVIVHLAGQAGVRYSLEKPHDLCQRQSSWAC